VCSRQGDETVNSSSFGVFIMHATLLGRAGAAIVLIALAASAEAQAIVKDRALTDSAGMTLYVYDNDLTVPGKSVCGSFCGLSWPPLLAADGAKPSGEYTIVVRDDGKRQWAYKGRPLYTWINDKSPGDKTGEGFKQIWHVARP
jgi:predicted lipoprotein with Yx(FWY)xxD motif